MAMDAGDLALIKDGNDAFGNSSAFWIFALLILAGGGFNGFGNRYQPQYATQDFVQNGFNFNDLQDQNRDLMDAVTNGTAQSIAATQQAKYDTMQNSSAIESDILRETAEIKENQRDCTQQTQQLLNNMRYERANDTAAIQATNTANAQKILDAITGNRMADMQNQINQLQLQNAINAAVNPINSQLNTTVKYPTSWTYNAGMSPFCQCNCGTV